MCGNLCMTYLRLSSSMWRCKNIIGKTTFTVCIYCRREALFREFELCHCNRKYHLDSALFPNLQYISLFFCCISHGKNADFDSFQYMDFRIKFARILPTMSDDALTGKASGIIAYPLPDTCFPVTSGSSLHQLEPSCW